MAKITIETLRKIISEEIQLVREGANEDAAAGLASNASKLLKAIESFKEAATAKAKADMGNHIEETEKLLKRMISSPMQYVDMPKPVVKKVAVKTPEEPAEKAV